MQNRNGGVETVLTFRQVVDSSSSSNFSAIFFLNISFLYD